MEKESVSSYTITEMQPEDIEAATQMRLQSWIDTYVNEEHGISREWVEKRNRAQLSNEKVKLRLERLLMGRAQGTFNAWVAKGVEGDIIGSTTPFIDEDGTRHLGSLYVDKAYHGTGVAHELMQKAMDWLGAENDIELGVVVYNERAKAFYRKWDFEEVVGSENLFADKIPEVKMVRKAAK